jgi:hypothetical protein
VYLDGEGFAAWFRAAVNRPRYVDEAPLGLGAGEFKETELTLTMEDN